MSNFIIDVPMPAMGATVSELTIVSIAVAPGAKVAKGEKLAELESDKSSFDFESPADGTIIAVSGKAGEIKTSGQTLFRLETSDASLKHLEIAGGNQPAPVSIPAAPPSGKPLQWTPRAVKLAQEAGLDPAQLTGIGATGPGGRVSGDDVTQYLANRKP